MLILFTIFIRATQAIKIMTDNEFFLTSELLFEWDNLELFLEFFHNDNVIKESSWPEGIDLTDQNKSGASLITWDNKLE